MVTSRKTVLITGAASGIGKCFMNFYLKQGWQVIATDINRIEQHKHDEQTEGPSLLSSYVVDFGDTRSIKELVTSIRSKVKHLELVIHSAGIRGLVPAVEASKPADVAAAETLDIMDAETILRTYQINTLGTFTLFQALHQHNLLKPEESNSKIIIMTSRMGSMSYNVSAGGGYAYRASKAALNAMIKSMSIDLPHVMFALVHPGRVETGLTKCREDGAIEVDESVHDMLQLIDRLDLRDSGRYMDRFGVEIGW